MSTFLLLLAVLLWSSGCYAIVPSGGVVGGGTHVVVTGAGEALTWHLV